MSSSIQPLPLVSHNAGTCSLTTLTKVAAITSLVTAVALTAFGFIAAGIAFALAAAGLFIFQAVCVTTDVEFIKNGMNDADKTRIDQAFEKIEAPLRAQLAADVRSLLSKEMDTRDKLNLIEELGKIDTPSRTQLIAEARPLCTGLDARSLIEIVQQLIKVDPSARARLIADSRALITAKMDGYQRSHVIAELNQIKDADRKQFIVDTGFLITDDTKPEDIIDIIRELKVIESSERTTLIAQARPLFSKMETHHKLELLQKLHGIETAVRAPLIADAQRLIPEETKGQEVSLAFDQLSHLDETSREAAIATASPFFSKLDIHERLNLVELIYPLPNKELRDQLVDDSLHLITNKMDGRDKLYIVEQLKEIDASTRSPLIRDALLLMNDEMDARERIELVKNLAEFSKVFTGPHRTRLITDAQPLFTEKTHSSDIIDILKKLKDIEPSKRSELITDAAKLFTKNISPSGRFSMIQQLEKIKPASVRSELIETVIPLFNNTMDGQIRLAVVNHFKDVDISLLKQKIAKALPSIQEGTAFQEIVRAIENPSHEEEIGKKS